MVARWHTHRVMAMLVFLSCARSGAARLRGVSESLQRVTVDVEDNRSATRSFTP